MLSAHEIDVDLAPGAAEKLDAVLALFVFALPAVGVMENVVVGQLEPLDLVWALIKPLHDAVPGGLLSVEIKDISSLHGFFGIKLHGEIRNDNVVFGNVEIVDHPRVGKWDIHGLEQFAVLIEERIVDTSCFHVIAKCA